MKKIYYNSCENTKNYYDKFLTKIDSCLINNKRDLQYLKIKEMETEKLFLIIILFYSIAICLDNYGTFD